MRVIDEAFFLKRYDVNLLIEQIMRTDPPIRISKIAEDLNEPISQIRRKISKLYNLGYGFKGDFDLRRIGLSTLVLGFNEPIDDVIKKLPRNLSQYLPFLRRWQGETFSPKHLSIALMYIPYNYDVLANAYGILEKANISLEIKPFIADISIIGKPRTKYFGLPDYLTNWELLYNDLKKEEDEENIKEILKIDPINLDLIDVLILASYQKDAFTPVSKIASDLKLSISKINRHLKTHIEKRKIFNGCSIKQLISKLNIQNRIMMLLIGKNEDLSTLLEFISIVKNSPEFYSALVDSNNNMYMMLFSIMFSEIDLFSKFIKNVKEYLGEYNIFILNPSTIKSYTIPFLAYNREIKNWDFKISVIDIMKEKLEALLKA
ncbi:MAG: hypothetical protein ACP5ML_02670 [Fervidicoccus sp.]